MMRRSGSVGRVEAVLAMGHCPTISKSLKRSEENATVAKTLIKIGKQTKDFEALVKLKNG